MLEEHVACSLLRVDPNAIVGDNGTEKAQRKICSALVTHLVAGSTLNSSAAYLRTAVNGVPSGTPST